MPTSADAWAFHIRRGEFEAAWRISDALLRERANVDCTAWPYHQQAVWRGDPLDGKRVLLRCYHGLGDTIHFIRYAPHVRRLARELAVWAQPELLPLLRTVRGIDTLLPLHDGAPHYDYDVDAELSELPHVFRTTLATIPDAVPYLHAVSATPPPDGRLHVGVVWAAGGWDGRRSVPFSEFERLADVPGVALHVLQRGPRLDDRPEGWGTVSGSDDAAQAASVIAGLDLIVSVDSMPAHLAGALGVPVWTLLHSDPDWRWMLDRDDSPWYPTMRLFRQRSPGEWGPVLARVASELRAVSRGLTRRPSSMP